MPFDVELITQTFKALDANNNGVVSVAELRAILSHGNNSLLSAEDIDEVISAFDSKGDGQLSIAEFAAAMQVSDNGDAGTAVDLKHLSTPTTRAVSLEYLIKAKKDLEA